MKHLYTFAEKFNEDLGSFVDQKGRDCLVLSQDPVFVLALEQVKKILLGGGKRIRPYNVYMGFSIGQQVSGDIVYSDPVKNYLLAIEVFHVFCLVHDDIIDKSMLRRNLPTVHAKIYQYYQETGRVGDIHHAAVSHGILMGDIMFSWVMMLIESGEFSDSQQRARTHFHEMIQEVQIGQMVDLDITTLAKVSSERIYEKMKMKTALYTFVRPLQIGYALAGGSDPRLRDVLRVFGTHLGIAFQIQDDILDIYGKKSVGGKQLCRDLQEGQHTLLTQYVYEHGSDKEQRELASFFRSEIGDEDVSCVQEFFQKVGAYDAVLALMAEEVEKAKTCIGKMGLGDEMMDHLVSLVEFVVERGG